MVNVAAADVRSHAIIQVFRASGVRLSGIANLCLSDVCIERFERPESELMPDERELISLARDAGLLRVSPLYEGQEPLQQRVNLAQIAILTTCIVEITVGM